MTHPANLINEGIHEDLCSLPSLKMQYMVIRMVDYQHYNMLWYGVLGALPQYNSTECILRANQWQVYEFYCHYFWYLHCSSPFSRNSQQCVADMFRNQIKKMKTYPRTSTSPALLYPSLLCLTYPIRLEWFFSVSTFRIIQMQH